ncbi:nitroreductase family protein [Globicatella sulfidifaciens]|uniref:Nitroreductase n=1 Tax=Globicatella sulfidifaciens TaxID=136093 RepID=A0A7X8C5K0_9LACT|nr:nitroreductase family protein [Globicatella sulfidifaciens]NLJ19400.1 nitroreductase [Globicatella sulfidifaciens]
MSKDFYKAIEDRRSFYGISKDTTVSEARIREIIDFAVKYTPSAFNSQSARVVLLLEKEHDKLWDITKEALRKIVPSDQFSSTENKINSFRNGYGTILYFEDQRDIENLQKQFELYKDNFPVWSQQSNGMLQFAIWSALGIEGLGASLQHYTELIETEVKKEWGIQDSWKLIAQMPFGNPTSKPAEKEYKSLEERIKVFK